MLSALLVAAALAGPLDDVFEAGVTYCVGGYDGTPPANTDACEQPAQRLGHWMWHQHNFVTDGKTCWSCWDEHDSTCQTSFLRRNPGWRQAIPELGECAHHAAADTVFQHVVDGQSRVAPPPPPTVLTPHIDTVAPGPHSIGDTVAIAASLRDEQGAVHPITGGRFRVTDAAGVTTEVRGKRRADGTVTVDLPLTSANPRVEFLPDPPSLGKGESLAAAASDALTLAVEVCSYRARIVAPVAGAALASGQPTTLRAALFDKDNAVPVATATSASLQFTLTVPGEADATLAANADLQASWTPPASPTARALTITAAGTVDGRVVCPAQHDASTPGGAGSATISDIGIGFATDGLPQVCYVGLACTGTVGLVRPESGAARQRVDALLADPGTTVVLYDNNAEVASAPARADDRYRFDATYPSVTSHSWRVEIHPAGGAPVVMTPVEVRVRLPLKLVLPETLDFGTIAAGTPWSDARACQKLDMGASQAALEHRWELLAVGTDGCEAHPVLAFDNHGTPDKRGLATALPIDALDATDLTLTVCLEVPRCAADTSPAGAGLRVTPLTPVFADQAKTVALRWTVTGQPWYRCHAPWLGPSAALATLGLLVLGVVRPARFSPAATVKVAGSEKGLKKASALVLVECPGASAGFYRDAALGLHADGDVNGRVRNALVRLRATRGPERLTLHASAPLELYDPRKRAWSVVPDGQKGHAPSPRALYRCGSTCFQVDPG